ncbi:hypothetical protein JD844_000141 [Phrynosoma platyrhinos]|uniref:2-oxoglutarate and iron-dependent oxygenase domain-containing protein 1 n=1 Tax=Phrynosoma platyrhinos TaxID=52577 RepID=A0ABQ7SQ84_PHRPL|nr:hypothetical protein JD844_000141 [Phrynosoma platyrhinos]
MGTEPITDGNLESWLVVLGTGFGFEGFAKSDDLKKRREPHIAALRKVLFEEFRVWLSDVIQVELEPTVDLSCAKYEYTDTLLCHDDELESRRIAFILYLVPPWDESDGGSLDLFSTDEHFQPLQIVSEVVSKHKCRLSVSGWFHGTSVARPSRHVESPLPRSPHIPHDHEILYNWINPIYLEIDAQARIQEEFEDRSEILLKNFLQEKGHANTPVFLLILVVFRHYEKAEEESLPAILKKGMELFRSEALFLLLSNFTGLKLHFLAPEEEEEGEGRAEGSSSKCTQGHISQEGSDSRDDTEDPGQILENENDNQETGSSVPLCAGELRHWTKGCYSLVHDAEVTEFALDLLFFCGCQDWDMESGGFTSYIAKGEDEELLTVNPEDNCLALIYRDQETLKFVKYINHHSLKQMATQHEHTGFWDFSFVYYE